MTDTAKKSLHDILEAISEIKQFLGQVENLESYKHNLIVRRATERVLAIIGEAIVRFEREIDASPISHNRNIRGLRNRLIHVYDDVDHETIWGVIITHLPVLEKEVMAILSNES